jgi:asparagine synthase (glutamine-hydrolysing)
VYEHRDGFSFASTALALTAVDGIDSRIDRRRVTELLASAIGSTRTLVDGVRRLGPGASRWVDGSGARDRRWWIPESIGTDDLGSFDAHADRLAEAFDRAVASAVDGHERVGISLSGGLDSSAIAATVASLPDTGRAQRRLRGYTSVPPDDWHGTLRPGWDRDEVRHVNDLVELHPSIDVTWIDIQGRDPFTHHEALWELGSPPAVNALNSTWMYAVRDEAMADGVTLLLNGANGNLAFSADGPRALVELARGGRGVRLGTEVAARSAVTGWSPMKVLRRELVTLLAPDIVRRHRARRRGEPSPVDRWRSTKLLGDHDVDLVGLLPHLGAIDHTGWLRSPDLTLAPIAARAESELASAAWWGFAHCDPTIDREVLEIALAQPEWYRRHGGIERSVVRRAMDDRLPASILQRRRRGAQLPDWFDRMTEARELWTAEAEAARDHPASRELIDVDRIAAVLATWPVTDAAMSRDERLVLEQSIPRALLISRYLRWFEDRSRRIAAGGPLLRLPNRD